MLIDFEIQIIKTKWKILEWDEKTKQTHKQTNKLTNLPTNPPTQPINQPTN